MRIVFTTQLPPSGFAELNEYELIFPTTPYFEAEALRVALQEATVLVSTFDFAVPASILQAAPHLQLIANFGVGFNNIDMAYARAHGLRVTNTPLPVIEPTAEHAFTLMCALAHRTAELDRKLRLTHSIRFGVMNNLGIGLYGKTLGIVGMGRIGQALARRALASGMTILYHNRHRLDADTEARYQATWVEMETLLRESDVVSLNLPYTPETHHLIGAEQFSQMKPTALLINTARGAHIDEQALIEALQTDRIAGAALDVFEHEPNIAPALLESDKVLLSPHIGTGSIDARMEMCGNVSHNILCFAQHRYSEMNLVQ